MTQGKRKEKPKREKEESLQVQWVCYYCGAPLGVGGIDGPTIGRCERCGRQQSGSGIVVIDKEVKKLYDRLAERSREV